MQPRKGQLVRVGLAEGELITASEISERLARQAEAVAAKLLPNGRRDGKEFVAGSTAGGEGKSLKVVVAGEKAGVWKDFATDESGDLLDLWAAARGISIADALREARDYLGVVTPAFTGSKPREYRRPEKPAVTRPKMRVLEYLRSRWLTDETIAAYRVAATPADDEIVFPFLRGGELINVKYLKLERPGGKKIVRQERDAEPCLFGWQAIPDRARSVVIAEGEIDAMTWFQMGFPALSTWSGAGNLQWVENEWERLAQFDRIYVGFDADDAGRAGAASLVDRLGRARCRIVETPFKDANECLARGLDRACFRDIVDSARSLDPKELRSATTYRDAVMARFFPPESGPKRMCTPFDKLTERGAWFMPGELVIVNGINGHGKTSFLSQMVLALLRQDALCCIASMEIKPDALLHRMTIQGAGTPEPSVPFIECVQHYWDGRLWMFDVVGTAKGEYLLDVFRYARACYGITWFVVDSLTKCGFDEDDYKAQKRFLDALCDFKNETDSTVFLVTHSRKLESEARTVDKMDIKGTGAIADLADIVTTLWRNKAKENKRDDDAAGRSEATVVNEQEKPDAIWYWQKNRNGDFERPVGLWFDQPTRQFLEKPDARPRAYVPFVRDVSQEGLAI